jgi:hypothetical protein
MADQIAAVIGSVRQAFPSHEVWGTREGDRAAHTVRVAFDDGVLLLTASYEFLGGKAPLRTS